MLEKILSGIIKVFKTLITVLVLFLVVLLFVQIVYRSVFSKGFPWVEELAKIIFVWAMFIGISLGVCESTHIKINFITDKLDARGLWQVTCGLKWAGVLVFFSVLLVSGFQFAAANANAETSMLQLKMWQVYSIIPISSAFCIVFTLAEMWQKLVAERRKPK